MNRLNERPLQAHVLSDFRRRWPQPPPIVTSVYHNDCAKLEPAINALCDLAEELAKIHPGILLQLADENAGTERANLARAADIKRRRWPEPPPAFRHLYLDEIHALDASLNSLARASGNEPEHRRHPRKEPTPCL